MNPSEWPVLRVQVDRVRYAMLQHLTDYEGGVSSAFEAQIKAQLTPENIERMVGDAVRAELPAVIRGAIQTALWKVKWDEQVSDMMFAAIGKVLSDMKGGAK